jgi:hypothetical protein
MRLFIYCLFDLTSLYAVLPIWSLIFSGPLVRIKIEVASLTPEHIIKHGELRFLIGLPVNWQAPIERLCPDQANQLHF